MNKKDFDPFFLPVMINNCTEQHVQYFEDFAVVGIGELKGIKPKWYYDEKEEIYLFIHGDVFIRGGNNAMTYLQKYAAVIRLWKDYNHSVTDHIYGFFNLLIYNSRRNKVFLFNCKFGMLPLYYAIVKDKLYFSSTIQSFIKLPSFSLQLNKSSLLQYMIFNYPVNDSTFIENVFTLPAASYIASEENTWVKSKYDHHTWLLHDPVYNFKTGTELVHEVMKSTVKRLAELHNPVGCVITGGWDGRLVLSYLKNIPGKDFFLYTYGKQNSPDIRIAEKLSEKFHYTHRAVYLDDTFIREYEQLASESIILSGGLRPANRGHYILMAKILSGKTRMVLSGNCGSNILKIIQSPGSVYNRYVLNLFNNKNIDKTLREIYVNYFRENPWVRSFINMEDFTESVLQSEIITDDVFPAEKRLYHFLLTNIERKYFGTEVATYSSYLYNYSPFIDTEFIETIIKTPFYGGHYPIFTNSSLVRYKLSRLYAELMKFNDPELAGFTSDRGFPVTWFLSWQGRLAGYLVKKMNKNYSKNDPDPFNHLKGLDNIFQKWKIEDDFFMPMKINSINDNVVKALSLSYWINHCLNNADS